jgi:hypothetical protein
MATVRNSEAPIHTHNVVVIRRHTNNNCVQTQIDKFTLQFSAVLAPIILSVD